MTCLKAFILKNSGIKFQWFRIESLKLRNCKTFFIQEMYITDKNLKFCISQQIYVMIYLH